ncbi:aminotransferase [Curvivirga sp.]|uniref:aminotransferase n=1 Tax=Curvivirga sp. TaxID=2856848 RepID=UPI003B5A1EA3
MTENLQNRLYDTEEIQEKDNAFIHPWEMMDTVGDNKRTVIAEGDGIYIYDSDNNKLMDGPGGMWCVNIGHRRQEMADAIAEQVMQLSYASPWSITNGPASVFADEIAKRAPTDMNHVFFTTGGSTAVDSAVRMAHLYFQFQGKKSKTQIISRAYGYHGSTFLGAAITGKPREEECMTVAEGLVHHIPCPNPALKPEAMSMADFLDEKIADLENKILELGADNVACFVAEPIMASGGVIVPPEGYHKRTWEICKKYDVLYISDEVVTAFGRLGHYFASEDVFDIVPDFITTAKGLTSGYVPCGAVVVHDRIIKAFKEGDNNAMYSNGYTYSGHPVACAAGLKNMEIIDNEGLLAHVREVAPYFQSRLRELLEMPLVTEVRGMGLMASVECRVEGEDDMGTLYKVASLVDQYCQELGLIVRPIYSSCVMSPPLTITKDQIDDLVGMLRQGIERAQDDLIKEGVLKA